MESPWEREENKRTIPHENAYDASFPRSRFLQSTREEERMREATGSEPFVGMRVWLDGIFPVFLFLFFWFLLLSTSRHTYAVDSLSEPPALSPDLVGMHTLQFGG